MDILAVLAARDRLLEQPDVLLELVVFGALPAEDLWPARGIAQLFGTIAQAGGATGVWRELARASLKDGWTHRPG